MSELLLIENGNGGDIVQRGNDFVLAEGLENAVYLALFGGKRWWGNTLLTDDIKKFLCKTEEALKNTALNSAGRIVIEDAIKEDLSFLDNVPGTVYKVSTTIQQPNRLDITININGKAFILQWNPDRLFLTYKVG